MVSKYQDCMCQEIIDLASEGKSITQIAAIWGVSKKTIERWVSDTSNIAFSDAYDKALTACEAYWEREGQIGIRGLNPKFNLPGWQFLMKSRFKKDWTESSIQKVEKINDYSTMSNDEINEAIRGLLAQKIKNNDNNSGQPANVQ